MRLVLADGSLAYENGDMTRSRNTGACHCGFKHWWNGREYDLIPEIVSVILYLIFSFFFRRELFYIKSRILT